MKTEKFKILVERANCFMEDEDFVDEAQEDDAFITDKTRGGYGTSCSGKFLGNFREYNDAVIAIGDCMKDSNWFPNVWNVNERGSMDLITDFDATYKKALEDKAQIKAEDEIESELEKSYEEQ